MNVALGVLSRFTLVKSQPSNELTNGKTVAEERVKHRVSGPARSTEKERTVAKVVIEEHGDSINKGYRPEHVTRCGRETWTICVVHIHNNVKWSKTCDELRSMYMTCLAQQVDIICGYANQAWASVQKTHKTDITYSKSNVHPEPLNGLVNPVAHFEVARLNRGQPLYHSVCMEYIDNNAYEITACHESHYDMWDCCFIQLFSYGKQTDDQRATERTISQEA